MPHPLCNPQLDPAPVQAGEEAARRVPRVPIQCTARSMERRSDRDSGECRAERRRRSLPIRHPYNAAYFGFAVVADRITQSAMVRPRVRYFGRITVSDWFLNQFISKLPDSLVADIREYNHYTKGVYDGRYIQVRTFTFEGNEVLVWDRPIDAPKDLFLTQLMLLS